MSSVKLKDGIYTELGCACVCVCEWVHSGLLLQGCWAVWGATRGGEDVSLIAWWLCGWYCGAPQDVRSQKTSRVCCLFSASPPSEKKIREGCFDDFTFLWYLLFRGGLRTVRLAFGKPENAFVEY